MYTDKLKYSENLMHLLKKTKFSSTFNKCYNSFQANIFEKDYTAIIMLVFSCNSLQIQSDNMFVSRTSSDNIS